MLSDDEIRKIIIKRKKRTYAIRRALAGALLLIVLFFIVLPSRVDSSFDREAIKSSVDEAAAEPEIAAEAAELYSLELERPVYQKNADRIIDPYSITKILTCYLVLENVDPDKKVKITKNKSVDYVDGSHILLLEGEELTVRDLLHATMLTSANDAAYYLAIAAAGSEKAFAEMMNKQVEEWGCENTHFVNPNGWKHKDHYTTAHDMAIITARCFESEALRELSTTKKYHIDANEQSEERNLINFFLHSVKKADNITCGKTGSWEEDDCSIALEFKEGNLSAALVLLRDNMEQRTEDIIKLQEYSHKVTPGFIVGTEGAVVCSARVKGGEETVVPVAVDKSIYAYPKSGNDKDIKVALQTEPLEAPLKKGTKAGTYTVIVDGTELESGNLMAAADVEPGWLPSKLYISNRSTLIGLGIIAFALCLRSLLKQITRSKRHKHKPQPKH